MKRFNIKLLLAERKLLILSKLNTKPHVWQNAYNEAQAAAYNPRKEAEFETEWRQQNKFIR